MDEVTPAKRVTSEFYAKVAYDLTKRDGELTEYRAKLACELFRMAVDLRHFEFQLEAHKYAGMPIAWPQAN